MPGAQRRAVSRRQWDTRGLGKPAGLPRQRHCSRRAPRQVRQHGWRAATVLDRPSGQIRCLHLLRETWGSIEHL